MPYDFKARILSVPFFPPLLSLAASPCCLSVAFACSLHDGHTRMRTHQPGTARRTQRRLTMGVGEQGGPASSALRPVEDELSEDESSPEALAPRPASAPAASAAPAPTPMLQVTPSGPRPSATPGTGFFHSAGGASAAQLPGPPSAPSPSKRELQRQGTQPRWRSCSHGRSRFFPTDPKFMHSPCHAHAQAMPDSCTRMTSSTSSTTPRTVKEAALARSTRRRS